MSDYMMRVVIAMPLDLAMSSELSRLQYHARANALLADRADLYAENQRLRDALEHIRAMQLRGFLVLGDKANGLMKAALAGRGD